MFAKRYGVNPKIAAQWNRRGSESGTDSPAVTPRSAVRAAGNYTSARADKYVRPSAGDKRKTSAGGVMRSAMFALAALVAVAAPAAAQDVPAYGPMLEGFDYPYPIQHFEFVSQRQDMQMAYMDVTPEPANGETVVLLHGKNFCAATWKSTMDALLDAGYRVVAPDQIGFCKSTKPDSYQYSLHQLAANTHALTEKLGLDHVNIMGHSMGGMLAMRYAMQFPGQTEGLVLVNPIGLEDWKAKGVPYLGIDAWFESQKETDFASIKSYQKSTYYAGEWRAEYDRWVKMLAGMYKGEDGDVTAWHQTKTTDMVFTQPVVYELDTIEAPTLLFIGEQDNTAIGKGSSSEAVQARLGDYSVLGEQAAARIPDATLVEFPDLAHSPHIQEPARFNARLIEELAQLGEEDR